MAITDYCECDNTHLNNLTVCQFCWENGERICQRCKIQFNVNQEGTDTCCQSCCDDYAEEERKAGRA